jgi:hypothetical protein
MVLVLKSLLESVLLDSTALSVQRPTNQLLTAVPADAAQLEVTVRKGALRLFRAPKACIVLLRSLTNQLETVPEVTTVLAEPYRQLQLMEQLEIFVQLEVIVLNGVAVTRCVLMAPSLEAVPTNANRALPACSALALVCLRLRVTAVKAIIVLLVKRALRQQQASAQKDTSVQARPSPLLVAMMGSTSQALAAPLVKNVQLPTIAPRMLMLL